MNAAMKSGFFLVALLVVSATWAQDYPSKPVKMVAPSPPGGAMDVLSRIVSQKLGEKWSHAVIVENRGGASGNIGAEFVAKSSAPDGYTLLIAGTPHAINMSLFRDLRYDLTKDLAAITAVAAFPSLIALHPSVPATSVKELIALARARPGELNYGSAGSGSPNHFSMEIFKSMAKVNMVHIPYKGSGPLLTDLLAGHVQLASMGLPPSLRQVKAGKLRAIAVTGRTRSPLLPDVPTVSESGLPGFDVSSWYGVFCPAGLSRDLVTKLNVDIVGILGATDMRERLASLGAEPIPMSPDDFARFVRQDIAKWAKVVAESGAKAY